jgi:acetyl-CoA C-acetyltransferase
MGLTAENVAERCHVTREQQDEWAVVSQNRAVDARDSGHFDKEIVAVTTPDGTVVTQDDGPRPGTTMEKLAALQPGVQAGRDGHRGQRLPAQRRRRGGAVMSDEKAKSLGLKPRAGSSPRPWRRSGPRSWASARSRRSRELLEQAGMTMDDVDVVEINEAFAAQIVPCKEELGIDDDKLNPFGGAIALGHPFGMTGARIMTTLLNDLETLDKQYGVESMCVAGGMGQAMLVERLN